MDKTINNVTHHIDFHYDINNQITSLTYNNQDYFYIRNVLGTILGIMNSSGNLITRYTYSSYGEPTITILANNDYGWSHGIFEGGYQTPNTPGITLLAINGGVNGGRSLH